MPEAKDVVRERAIREAQAVAQVAGRASARALWSVLRVLLIFVAMSSLAYRFLVMPRMDFYQRQMQYSGYSNAGGQTLPNGVAQNRKYKWHYELTDAQKKKLVEAWPKEITHVYVLSPDESSMYDTLNAESHQQKVDEGRTAAKDFAQVFWDNSIDAAMVDETKSPRYRNSGLTLVMNAPEDGSLAVRPHDVDLLLAVFRAIDVPASCCQREPGIPDGSVGIVVGPR